MEITRGKGKGVMGMDDRELGFFQKGRQVAKAMTTELNTWPKSMQSQEIGRQLFRADKFSTKPSHQFCA